MEKLAREYALDHFYCEPDEDTGERYLWEPYEHFDEGQIAEMVDGLTEAFISFAKAKGE